MCVHLISPYGVVKVQSYGWDAPKPTQPSQLYENLHQKNGAAFQNPRKGNTGSFGLELLVICVV